VTGPVEFVLQRLMRKRMLAHQCVAMSGSINVTTIDTTTTTTTTSRLTYELVD